MLRRLNELSSFAQPRDSRVFDHIALFEGAWLRGIYFNDPSDFIVITDRGLNWVHDDLSQSIPYAALESVRTPDDDERALYLQCHDGTEIVIDIINDTDGAADVHVLRD